MSTASLQLGSVIWVELTDVNGFRKVRPAVVLSATADIDAGQLIRVAAITTRLPHPLPKDHVLLPWEPQGKARSGLRRKCAAVTTWLAEVPVVAVQQVVGLLSPSVIAQLLDKIEPSPVAPPLAEPKDSTAPESPEAPPSTASDS